MERDNDQATQAALMQRDALMTLLIAQSMDSIQQLALLAGSEKAAVARLVAIGQAMAHYSRSTNADSQVNAGFDRVMGSFSPLLDERAGAALARDAYLERPDTGHALDPSGCKSKVATVPETEFLIGYLKALLVIVSPPSVNRQVVVEDSSHHASRR